MCSVRLGLFFLTLIDLLFLTSHVYILKCNKIKNTILKTLFSVYILCLYSAYLITNLSYDLHFYISTQVLCFSLIWILCKCFKVHDTCIVFYEIAFSCLPSLLNTASLCDTSILYCFQVQIVFATFIKERQ